MSMTLPALANPEIACDAPEVDQLQWLADSLATLSHDRDLPRSEAASNGGILIKGYLRHIELNFPTSQQAGQVRDLATKPGFFDHVSSVYAEAIEEHYPTP
jgi:hypothetical protein